MSKAPKEYMPYVGPDALRQTTHLMDSFFKLHTDRYYGHQDIDGSQYEGTVENWGSEMLLESRKMYMTDPPIKNLFIENTLDYYFEIKHSHLIDTYNQQNMLVAVLRKDVLLSDRSYILKYENVERFVVPRAKAAPIQENSKVYEDTFYHTTTPPTLVISKQGEPEEEIVLKLSDDVSSTTHYYFHMATESELPGHTLPTPSGGELVTYPLLDSYHGFPFIWITTSKMQLLPDIGFVNNTFDSDPFLTIGTNGHDKSYCYPIINRTISNVNYGELLNHYLVKVFSDDSFVKEEPDMAHVPLNYTARISKIELMYFDDINNVSPSNEPTSVTEITYDSTYTKLCLMRDISFNINEIVDNPTTQAYSIENIEACPFFGRWFFDKPVDGDYDYDPAGENMCYAYTSLTSFISDVDDFRKDPYLIPGFKVIFDPEFLNDYEVICENAYAGVHIDVTADYSDHGVSKKNGVIHNMGDFDGLPSYFSEMLPDTVHRAHIEIYAIRDQLNKKNQKAMDKPTAGIIIDSGIPKNEVNDVVEGMEPVIKYKPTLDGHILYTNDGADINIKNALTEITYTDPENFGNSTMSKHASEKKFVYHGNMYFSLGIIELDPLREYGRVYIVSNDRAKYENNDLSLDPKPARTFARICDIPTYFDQLVYVKGVSPTIIIDKDYVRTSASYDNSDKDTIYNATNRDRIIMENRSIFCYEYNAPDESEMKAAYPKYVKLNATIDVSDDTQVEYDISSAGSGYEVGDISQFYIGGNSVEVVVTAVDDPLSGAVTAFKFIDRSTGSPVEVDMPSISQPNQVRTNFTSRSVTYNAGTKTGSGSGLVISLTIDETVWNNTAVQTTDPTLPIFYLMKDHAGIIWAEMWDADSDAISSYQITEPKFYYNPYDTSRVGTTETFLRDLIVPNNNDYISDSTTASETYSNIPKTVPLNTHDDLSSSLNLINLNIQNGIYIVTESGPTTDTHNVVRYQTNTVVCNQSAADIPNNSDLNLNSYINKSNKLRYASTNDDEQPKLEIFDPYKTTTDTMNTISNDVVKHMSSRDISLRDVFDSSDLTPTSIMTNGVLDRNVYWFNEFNQNNMDYYENLWREYPYETLIEIIRAKYPDSEPIRFIDTEYQYSKDMLVDYLMMNRFNWSDDWNEETTDRPASIYRRPEIEKMRSVGDEIYNVAGKPVGTQPTGAFITATDTVYDRYSYIGTSPVDVDPVYVFRLDIDDVGVSLDGFRLYDDMDNDITAISLVILNGVIYSAKINNGVVTWRPINRDQI